MGSNFLFRSISSSFPVRCIPRMAVASASFRNSTTHLTASSISEAMGFGSSSTAPFQSFQQTRGLKVGVSITRRCENCYIVVRNGVRYVYCKVNRRHKRRQG